VIYDFTILLQDGWTPTPLMAASSNGHTDVVQTLIEAKAQIDTQKEDGWTALHVAAHAGGVDVVRLLTGARALVNMQSGVLSCLMIGLLLVYTVQ
jgi:ankyrin repeat protein